MMRFDMKSPTEVLRSKELELQKVKQEVEALRIAARILEEESPQPSTKKLAQVVQLP